MSEHWKDHGASDPIADALFNVATFGLGTQMPTTHTVQDTDTGEYREVIVGHGQDVGDAIANGQFKS